MLDIGKRRWILGLIVTSLILFSVAGVMFLSWGRRNAVAIARNGHSNTLFLLLLTKSIKKSDRVDLLKESVNADQINVVQVLFSYDREVVSLADNLDLLYYCCLEGRYDMAVFLCDAGVDPMRIAGAPSFGRTPLGACALYGSQEKAAPEVSDSYNTFQIAKMLIDRGVDVRGNRTPGIWSPIQQASWANNKEMIQLLIKNGADVDVTFGNRSTPILISCSLGHYDTVSLLLSLGANVSICDSAKNTVFHKVIMNDTLSDETVLGILSLFKDGGHLVESKNLEGLTPLELAIKNKRGDKVIQRLKAFNPESAPG